MKRRVNRRHVIGSALATAAAAAAWPLQAKAGDIVIGQSAPVSGPVADALDRKSVV